MRVVMGYSGGGGEHWQQWVERPVDGNTGCGGGPGVCVWGGAGGRQAGAAVGGRPSAHSLPGCTPAWPPTESSTTPWPWKRRLACITGPVTLQSVPGALMLVGRVFYRVRARTFSILARALLGSGNPSMCWSSGHSAFWGTYQNRWSHYLGPSGSKPEPRIQLVYSTVS